MKGGKMKIERNSRKVNEIINKINDNEEGYKRQLVKRQYRREGNGDKNVQEIEKNNSEERKSNLEDSIQLHIRKGRNRSKRRKRNKSIVRSTDTFNEDLYHFPFLEESITDH